MNKQELKECGFTEREVEIIEGYSDRSTLDLAQESMLKTFKRIILLTIVIVGIIIYKAL